MEGGVGGLDPNVQNHTFPLDLKFTNPPWLLERIKTLLDQAASCNGKAANFHALSLKIGSWQIEAKHVGDITAKCYFAKKRLVWEVLIDDMKRKIDIQWDCVWAIKATFLRGQPSILEIELKRPPAYLHESDPQPRKLTMWQNSRDFTNDQAQIHKKHTLTFEEGVLEKHYDRLLSNSIDLYLASKRSFSILYPFFIVDEMQHDDWPLPQPPLLEYPSQPPPLQQFPIQYPTVDTDPGTSSVPEQNISYQPGFGVPNCSTLIETPVMADTGLDSISAMNALSMNEINQFPLAVEPLSSRPGVIDPNAAMSSQFPTWDQGYENINDSVVGMENLNIELQQRNSSAMDSTPGGLNGLNAGYYHHLGDPSSSMAPRVHDQTVMQMDQTPSDSNIFLSPNDHYPNYGQAYPVPHVVQSEDSVYFLSSYNNRMSQNNQTNNQLAQLENGFLLTDGNEQNTQIIGPETTSRG